VGGLLKYLELDRGEASEGVLRASAVVGVLDPGDDRKPELLACGPPAVVETFFCSREKNDSMAALSRPYPANRTGWWVLAG
jgi:hypothetical protein